jgi:uncharacterized protein YdiU (UPF0061 family)
MFYAAIRPLLAGSAGALARLDQIREGFRDAMNQALEAMWVQKLGLSRYDAELVDELFELMVDSSVDYTIFFSRLSSIPEHRSTLNEAFYRPTSEQLDARWTHWLGQWRAQIMANGNRSETAAAMQRVNPQITWREWLVAPRRCSAIPTRCPQPSWLRGTTGSSPQTSSAPEACPTTAVRRDAHAFQLSRLC